MFSKFFLRAKILQYSTFFRKNVVQQMYCTYVGNSKWPKLELGERERGCHLLPPNFSPHTLTGQGSSSYCHRSPEKRKQASKQKPEAILEGRRGGGGKNRQEMRVTCSKGEERKAGEWRGRKKIHFFLCGHTLRSKHDYTFLYFYSFGLTCFFPMHTTMRA